jgi:hypothetical protein
MPYLGSRLTLSAHEILRFSIEQASMRFRHVGLHRDRISISLRDHTRQRNLWELMDAKGRVRLTRFPKLHPQSFDGPAGNRFEGSITPELFARVVATHRSAIVLAIREQVAHLADERATASGPDAQSTMATDDRLQEIRQVASHLFPHDFPG